MTLYLSLTSASLIPSPLTAMIVSRDVLLVYAGLYIRYMSVQPPVGLCQSWWQPLFIACLTLQFAVFVEKVLWCTIAIGTSQSHDYQQNQHRFSIPHHCCCHNMSYHWLQRPPTVSSIMVTYHFPSKNHPYLSMNVLVDLRVLLPSPHLWVMPFKRIHIDLLIEPTITSKGRSWQL